MFDIRNAALWGPVCALALTACSQPATHPHRAVASVQAMDHGRHLTLESSPSSSAAPLLPPGAHYRVILVGPDELALLVLGPDDRIAGRLRVEPLDRANASGASTITIDDFGGPLTTVEVWTGPGGLRGQTKVGDQRAHWRVRLDADGSLAGERWSPRHAKRSTQLRRARALGADLAQVAASLRRSGSLEASTRRDLSELIALTELALDLSVRAWEGHDRAHLPKVGLEPLSVF